LREDTAVAEELVIVLRNRGHTPDPNLHLRLSRLARQFGLEVRTVRRRDEHDEEADRRRRWEAAGEG
jgi:hypothetical protein